MISAKKWTQVDGVNVFMDHPLDDFGLDKLNGTALPLGE